MPPPGPLGLTGQADLVDPQLWHFSITNVQGDYLTCYWGDQSETTVSIETPPQDVTLDHRYAVEGDYTITAHSAQGNQNDTQFTITVAHSDYVPPLPEDAFSTYTDMTELARILKIRDPSDAQKVAMQRVIDTAAGEINSEIDLAPGSALEDWQLQLASSVNLDRAADLWRHTESVPGVLGALDEALMQPPLRYSWERYAQRLAPLKDRWGLA